MRSAFLPWAEFVLSGIPLTCAAFVAISSGQLTIFLGLFVLVGGVLGSLIPGELAILFAIPIGFAPGMAGGMLLRKLRGMDYALVGVCIAEFSRLAFANSRFSAQGLGFQTDGALRPSELGLVLTAAVVSLIITRQFAASAMRRSLDLAEVSEASAGGSGVDVARLRVLSAGVAGALAAIGGVVHIRSVGIVEPSVLGFEFGILALAPVLIAGTRQLAVVVVAAIGLAWITRGLELPSDWRGVGVGILIILATLGRGHMMKPRAIPKA